MKKYLNLIILGIIGVAALSYFIVKTVNFNDLLVSAGYYEKKITIMNTADIHGHLIYNNVNGEYFSLDEEHVEMGMALIKTIVDEVRAENKDSLLLDSGDVMHGTPEAQVNQGEGMVEALNLVGYDAMALGNHDFNWGWQRTMEFRDMLNFPMISANIYKDGKPAFDEYKIFEVGGKKIGVFGITTQQFLQNMQVYDRTGITYEDPIAAANRMVATLRELQVDAIVMLSHHGDDKDKVIIENVEGIDLTLSGHSHNLYEEEVKVNDTYQAEAGSYSTHVGVADMYFRNGKVAKVDWRVVQIKDKTKGDPQVAAIADKYAAIAWENGKEALGTALVPLDGLRFNVRTKETNLANLVTDAMREVGEAEIALFNGGGIRESIGQGEIRLYNVQKAFPFVNSLMTIELEGEKIYSAIEHGLKPWPYGGSNGAFLQVSGISYTIDGSKPAGKRLVSVMKDGKPLDKNKVYTVAITDYLHAGGDHYEEFKDAKVISRGELLSTMIANYIKSKGQVSPQLEDRIIITNMRYK